LTRRRLVLRTYAWTRFLAPITATFHTDRGGYLLDPEEPYGKALNPEAQSLGEWSGQKCLVILGESGVGKSRTIAEYVAARQGGDHRTLSFDLADFGNEERLIRKVFESPRLREWVQDGGNLELVLDSFDECYLRVSHLPRLLTEGLEELPRDRLNLRVVCRMAVWPQTLRAHLHEWWPDLTELEMLPLRERDVRTAAEARHVDAAAFIAAVRERGVEALAARPMTLDWLLDAFSAAAALPANRYQLWEDALLRLCEEPPERQANVPPRIITSRQALSVAARIAGCLLLSGKAAVAEALPEDQDVLDASGLIGGPEGEHESQVEITPATLRLVLNSTGLFSGRGPAKFGFVHQALAEFLAARYLATNSFGLAQLLSLLRVPDIDDLRIAPPLFGVAAWLASMRNEVFEAVAVAHPEILVFADLREAGQRRRVLEGLLARVEAGRARRPHIGSPVPYHNLTYDGMDDDLRPWLSSPRSNDARRIAFDIVEDCRLTTLSNELAAIALDPAEPAQLRLDAALAVAKIGPDEAKERLKPLALGVAGADPDDDLKGAGLMATWPAHLTEAELFHNLTPPKRPNYGGMYSLFQHSDEIVDRLSPEGLAMGTVWAQSQVAFREGPPFYGLAGRIIARAVRHLEHPAVLPAIVEFMLACYVAQAPLFEPSLAQDEPDHLADSEIRRRLISSLAPRIQTEQYFPSWAEWQAKLLRPEDFSWLIERGREAPAEDRITWGRLARSSWNPRDEAHARAIAALDRDDPTAADWLPIPREPAPEAPVAPAPVAAQRQTCPDEVRQALPPALERAEQEPRAWWRVARLLAGRFGHRLDITASPCWEQLPEDEQARIVRGAQQYLATAEADPKEVEEMHTAARFAGVLWAGYQALGLLAITAPAALDQIAPPLWQRWCPIVLLIFGQESEREREVHQSLVRQTYARAAEAVLAVVRRALRGRQASLVLSSAILVWDDRLAAALMEEVRALGIEASDLEHLLRILIERRVPGAREAAVELANSPRDPESPARDRSVAAGRALLLDAAAWPQLWPVIEADPLWGRDVLLDPRGWTVDDDFAALVSGLPETHLGRLGAWFIRQFPYEVESGDAWSSAAWRRHAVLDALRHRGTPAAAAALQAISTEFPQYPWLHGLTLEAVEMADARLWTPIDHRNLLRLARDSQARVVVSGEQLLTTIQESLVRLEERLQGPPHPVRFLWNRDWHDQARAVPRIEPDLSDWIADHLERDLAGRKLVVNREVEVTRRHLGPGFGDRTDIKVDASTGVPADRISAVLEVKGCWNQELRTGMEQQLVDQYLAGDHLRYGIYVVGWFMCDLWPDDQPNKGRSGFATLDDCRAWMAAEAERLTRTRSIVVRSIVIDCRWRL